MESADLIAYGLIPEFIGRFPILVSLSALTEDQLMMVFLPCLYCLQSFQSYIFSCSKQFSVPRTDSACLLLLMMIDFVLPFLMLYTYKDWNLYGFSLLKVLNLRCSLTISRFCYIFIIYIFLIINFNIFIKIIIKLIKKKKI